MTVEVLLASLLLLVIAVPHVLPLQRVTPSSAAAVWFLALCLRAVAAVGGAFYLLFYFPRTDHFVTASNLCLDRAVAGTHVHVSSEPFVYTGVAVPALLLSASLLGTAFGRVRTRLYARRLGTQLSSGDGP